MKIDFQDGSGETIFFAVFILFFGAVFTLFGYALIKVLVVIFGFIFCATVTYVSLERLTDVSIVNHQAKLSIIIYFYLY